MVSSACTSVHRSALVGTTGTSSSAARGTTSGATVASSSSAAGSGGAGVGGLGAGATGGADGLLSDGTDLLGGDQPAPAGTTCTNTVKIGASYSSDEATGLAAVGNPAAAAANADYVKVTQGIYQRLVDDLNARGGIAGCPVEVVYHDFQALAADGFSGQSQKECADFAEDQHVFAVIAAGLENRTLISCLAQHNVPLFYNAPEYTAVTSDYAQYRGSLYQLHAVNPDRYGPYIDLYQQAGYFSDLGIGQKVGILEADDGTGNNQRLVDEIWKPRLAALGITPVVFTFHMITGYSEVASTTSQLSSAVLQFKGQNVTHVMTTPDGGDVAIFFTQVAEQQGYRPRYAMHTLSSIQAWFSEPAGQRPNAVGISYTLGDILGSNVDDELATNAPNDVRTRCDALLKGNTGPAPVSAAYFLCDAFNFMQVALTGAPAVTPEALLAGADALSGSLPLAAGYGNASFGPPAKYDGGTAVRVLVWDEPAQRWHYVTDPVAIP